ncbi:hypothetical protein BDR07DRAFT_1449758 [Suillus spraguei]|nr:hypothetical protein BDR07DRAFT_1449758 [Suillus spraguei]
MTTIISSWLSPRTTYHIFNKSSIIREIINKLEDALEVVYCPCGYGASDLDIATLLLFALNKKLSLPSLQTLQTCSVFTIITPTISSICDEHLDKNIRSVVLNTCISMTPSRGVSFMVNEMAIHYSKYNKIGGLIAQKIHDGEVHLGKKVTVIGAARFGEEELHPILAAPTCKTECASDMEGVITRAIQCWSATGADQAVGSIWSFATDGDATQCAAGHKLFVKNPLSPHSQLYGILSNMPGLNTLMGDNKVMLDFNFKHIFKHKFYLNKRTPSICTLIHSPVGIALNNGRVINAMMLSYYLVWLPAYDKKSVSKLLHPDDPRAIELMQAIIDFSNSQHTILTDLFSLDIDTHADLTLIMILSNVIESILAPFTNINLSLTEQVQYLSHYAHLMFALFHSH